MRLAQWVLVKHYGVQLGVGVVFSHLATLAKFSRGFVNYALVVKVEVEEDLLVILGEKVYVASTGFEDAKSVFKIIFKVILIRVARFLPRLRYSKSIPFSNKKSVNILKINLSFLQDFY